MMLQTALDAGTCRGLQLQLLPGSVEEPEVQEPFDLDEEQWRQVAQAREIGQASVLAAVVAAQHEDNDEEGGDVQERVRETRAERWQRLLALVRPAPRQHHFSNDVKARFEDDPTTAAVGASHWPLDWNHVDQCVASQRRQV